MSDLYDWFVTIVFWTLVVVSVGIVIRLAWRLQRRRRHRRWYYKHRQRKHDS